MKFDKHGNGNGYDDLYILPENDEENKAVISFLTKGKFYFERSFSNIPGNDWFGKSFIDVPFCEYLKMEIIQSVGSLKQ